MLIADLPQANVSIQSSLLALELSLVGLIEPSNETEIFTNTTELRGIIGDINGIISIIHCIYDNKDFDIYIFFKLKRFLINLKVRK